MATGTNTNTGSPALLWYPLRVTYSRELKVREMLVSEGLECFIPMTVKTETRNGEKVRKTVPAINNLCFVRGARAELEQPKVRIHIVWISCRKFSGAHK